MTSNLDIYRCAKLLVDRYGDQATLHAAHRAEALNEKGDIQGAAVWVQIRSAAIELMRSEPDVGSMTH